MSPLHHDIKHLFRGCFRRDKSYHRPISTALSPQLHPSAGQYTNTTVPHTSNNNAIRSLDSEHRHVSYPQLDPAYSNFIYDVFVFTKGGKIRRLLVLDFRTDVNIMSESVYQRLNTQAVYCDPSIRLYVAGMGDMAPIGSVSVKWTLWGDHTVYSTRFYVVKGCQFDMLLGRPSAIEHQLSKKDAAVGARIQSSYQLL